MTFQLALFMIAMTPDKRGYPNNIFLISAQKTCWYSLEVSHSGTSNEYPKHVFTLK